MKIHYLLGMLLMAGIATNASAQVSNDNEDGVYKIQEHTEAFVPGQIIVKFKDDSNIIVSRRANGHFRSAGNSAIDKLLGEYGVADMENLFPEEKAKPASQLRSKRAPNGAVVKESNLDKVFLIKTDECKSSTELVERLQAMPEVEYAEPNYYLFINVEPSTPMMPNNRASAANMVINRETETAASYICPSPTSNPLYSQQYGITQQNVQCLWDKKIINKKRPVIAIVDTGVDISHPDLTDNIWTNLSEADGETGYDDDNNGYRDDVNGWNFVGGNANVNDDNRHGTHCAGIAAAVNNNLGIVGANPLARIMPVKVMDSNGRGDAATIAKGIVYAAKNGADIISMSLGGPILASVEKDALDFAYQSSIIVAAAGNSGMDIYKQYTGLVYLIVGSGRNYPGAYHLVLGVESTDKGGKRSSYSNYDPDGPVYSTEGVEGCNYEVQVAGRNIMSTLPNGQYGSLSGTSMSTPLMAGAVSALLMVKDYSSKNALWGDLIHLKADFDKIYSNTTTRKAMVDLVSMDIDDTDGNKNGNIDVGETVKFTPVLRNTWDLASGITLKLIVEDQYKNSVTILNPEVNFGNDIPLYGCQAAKTPFNVKFSDNIACDDDTKIKFTLEIQYNGGQDVQKRDVDFRVYNMMEISGMLTEDKTLTADRVWLVTSSLAIPEGVTVTIEPGTTIRFNDNTGISNSGTLIADGTPEKPIIMIPNETGYWKGIIGATLRYCRLFKVSDVVGTRNVVYENCILDNFRGHYLLGGEISYGHKLVAVNLINSYSMTGWYYKNRITNSNIINNEADDSWLKINANSTTSLPSVLEASNNWYNSTCGEYYFGFKGNTTQVIEQAETAYYGTGKEDILRKFIYEIGNADDTYTWYDLSNLKSIPNANAHGIVWKVCVNGKDAQDEYEDLAPLGVGTHKFEVYFNRPMNKSVAPKISFGLQEPYTQQEVNENGSWNAAGTIYTAYKTISGKTNCDGINRIYVYGAKDDEYFEIPYEKTRFNIQINATGSMATGFAAEAGLGKVELTWNNENNDFDDAMGFNIYRYTEETIDNPTRINSEIVDILTTDYTDYDVIPGTTYYYMYKVLSTDLKEYDASNVVSATPLTATLGDANGSGEVDVADVITTVNYAAGMEPKPFIFEAADMNKDLAIDILDVVGIIQKILNPTAAPIMSMAESTATYTIEDGVLYVESPVALAGIQVQLNLPEKKDMTVADDLNGFEQTSAWLSDNDYLFLTYSIIGKMLSAGKHALLTIGDAEISNIRLSDTKGGNVNVEGGQGTTSIDAMGSKVQLQGGVFNLKGQKVASNAADLQKLPKGVYIINGEKVVK